MTEETKSATPAPASPAKAKKPLWRRMLKWTLRALLLVVVLGIAAYAITAYWAAKTINQEVARIRSAGEPLTFTDLGLLTPQVERGQDARPFYAAACELVNDDFFEEGHDFEAFYGTKGMVLPVPAEMLARAQKNLEQNRLPLELLDHGSALPGCSWDIQLQYGMAVSLTQIGKPRLLLNAGSLRTRVLAVQGRGDEAVDSAIAELGLLRMCDRQPVLIDTLVQIAMLSRASQDATLAMGLGHPSEAALSKLGEALRHAHLIEPRRMFIAERVYFLEAMRYVIGNSLQSDPDSDGPAIPERGNWVNLGIAGRVMAAEGLPMYARFIDAAAGEFPAILTATEAVSNAPGSMMEKIIDPSFGKVMVNYGRSLAVYRSALVAVEIERYRRNKGALPETLAELPAKDLPVDPFTGSGLVYVKTADGYCVFSAGRNRADDDSRHVDREKDPAGWALRWGVEIRSQGK